MVTFFLAVNERVITDSLPFIHASDKMVKVDT